MVDKNPYENDDVDVPNFGETEEKGADPIFNMDTTSVTPETDAYTTEEEAESSSKVAIVVLIVFLVLFLVGTISGWLYGISKANDANTIKEEASALEVKLNKQITDLQTKVSTLEAELAEAKAAETTTLTEGGTTSSGTGEQTPTGTKYKMQDGVGIRKGAGTSNGYIDYKNIPDEIKELVIFDEKTGAVTTREAVFTVYETKNDSESKTWGRIAKDSWVRLDYGTKQ